MQYTTVIWLLVETNDTMSYVMYDKVWLIWTVFSDWSFSELCSL